MIEKNIIDIKENIKQALIKSGRSHDVELLAITKTVGVNKVEEAIKLGINNIGENRVQELEKKYDKIGNKVNYHMIGHLQSNKVKYLIGKTKLIHSLDRMSLAKEINKRSKNKDLITDVLIQVNVAEEKTKFGLKIKEVLSFIEKVLVYGNVNIRGLMTIAPHIDDEKELRKIFRSLYNLKKDIISRNYKELSMDYLSMGMTNDYKIAIEEGSNIIRVGTGIFGERDY